VHSSVEFSLDYMGFSMYRTGFRALEGSLEFDAARRAASSVNASILVAIVATLRPRSLRHAGSGRAFGPSKPDSS
jgi:polyisoprenoid-binding protein YceI